MGNNYPVSPAASPDLPAPSFQDVTGASPGGAQAAADEAEQSTPRSLSSTLESSFITKLRQKLGRLFHRKPEQSPLAQPIASPEAVEGVGDRPGKPEKPSQPAEGQPVGGQRPDHLERMTAPPGWKPGDPVVKTGPWSDTIEPMTMKEVRECGPKGLFRYTKSPRFSITPDEIRINRYDEQQKCLEKQVFALKWNDEDTINPISEEIATKF
jgi:hypothetical protein